MPFSSSISSSEESSSSSLSEESDASSSSDPPTSQGEALALPLAPSPSPSLSLSSEVSASLVNFLLSRPCFFSTLLIWALVTWPSSAASMSSTTVALDSWSLKAAFTLSTWSCVIFRDPPAGAPASNRPRILSSLDSLLVVYLNPNPSAIAFILSFSPLCVSQSSASFTSSSSSSLLFWLLDLDLTARPSLLSSFLSCLGLNLKFRSSTRRSTMSSASLCLSWASLRASSSASVIAGAAPGASLSMLFRIPAPQASSSSARALRIASLWAYLFCQPYSSLTISASLRFFQNRRSTKVMRARACFADFWNASMSSVSSGCSLSISFLVMYLQIWTIDEKLLSLAIPESDRIFSATSRKERCHTQGIKLRQSGRTILLSTPTTLALSCALFVL